MRCATVPPDEQRTIWGDSIDYIDGDVRTFATQTPNGDTSALGLYMNADAINLFTEDAFNARLSFPSNTNTFQFTFLEFAYTPDPDTTPRLYPTATFQTRFYTVPEDPVPQISRGPATYELPQSQLPQGYTRVPRADTNNDGTNGD